MTSTGSDRPILPVVVCGGAGTRLWPASRESMPKQFIDLIGDHSSFQAAIGRVAGAPDMLSPVVIASNEARFIVAEQLAQLNVSAEIILEPERRDSAAAVALATLVARRRHADAVVLIMPADHAIGDASAFLDAAQSAAMLAREGHIVTLGVVPHEPATGYGYIQRGEAIPGSAGFQVLRFVEKPGPASAARYVEEGYLWNAGYFAFRPEVMLGELQQFQPEILNAAQAALDQARSDLDFVRVDQGEFANAPKLSIDYAVMEHTDRAAVIPVSFPWSDLGSWDTLWAISDRDEDGNVLKGQVEVLDARNSIVHSDHLLTTVVGLADVVVVSTPDAVLVSSRERSPEVKELVAALRMRGRREADEHVRMYRPWGWYQRIDAGERFQVKRILVHPGRRLSLQKHFHRAEHWVVVSGTAEVTVDGRQSLVQENQAAYIPTGSVHRLANPGTIPLELIEIQVGSYTGEDDIVRIEDVYGR